MAYVIAQLSDVHIGGPHPGSGERFSAAKRSLIEPHAPAFVDWARGVQASRDSLFT